MHNPYLSLLTRATVVCALTGASVAANAQGAETRGDPRDADAAQAVRAFSDVCVETFAEPTKAEEILASRGAREVQEPAQLRRIARFGPGRAWPIQAGSPTYIVLYESGECHLVQQGGAPAVVRQRFLDLAKAKGEMARLRMAEDVGATASDARWEAVYALYSADNPERVLHVRATVSEPMEGYRFTIALLRARRLSATEAALHKGNVAYEEGNYAASARSLRPLAEQGVARAQMIMADLYLRGLAVERDEAEAMRWFRKAADQGEAHAQYMVGVMHAEGTVVPRSLAEAAKWYRKAADQGYAEAQNNLGNFYAFGQAGIAKDEAAALDLYRKAAAHGLAAAQYNLAVYYADGKGGLARDYSEAARLYRKATEQGYTRAFTNLGVLYLEGRGVAKDEVEAAKCFRKAADAGDAAGQFNLGVAYEEGSGVTKDAAQAAIWYRKAAEQGYSRAQAALGRLGTQ